MITQKISICMWKFLGLESIFSECLLFKIHTKITLLVSVVHYTGRYTQGNMHILNLNFRMYFGRYLLKTILCFLIFYFIIDSNNYAKNKEQNQSRQSVLYFFQQKYIQPNFLNHEKKVNTFGKHTPANGSLFQKRLTCICNACLF